MHFLSIRLWGSPHSLPLSLAAPIGSKGFWVNFTNNHRFVVLQMTKQTWLDFCLRTLIRLALTQCSEWLAANSICVPASLQFHQLYIKWSALFASDFTESKNPSDQLLKVLESSTTNLDEKMCWYEAIKLWFVLRHWHNLYVLLVHWFTMLQGSAENVDYLELLSTPR